MCVCACVRVVEGIGETGKLNFVMQLQCPSLESTTAQEAMTAVCRKEGRPESSHLKYNSILWLQILG